MRLPPEAAGAAHLHHGAILLRLHKLLSACVCLAVSVATPAQIHQQSLPTQLAAKYAQEIGQWVDGRMRGAGSSGMREAYLTPIFASSHAASLLALRNGDMLCFWFSGSWEGHSGVGIVESRLPAGSSQWTLPTLIDQHAGQSYQNPVGFQAPDGTLWLIHTTQPALQGEANSRVLYLQSHDNGWSWSAPKVLFDAPGTYDRNPLLVMPNGDWMLPLYHTTAGSPGKGTRRTDYSAVDISSDEGKTWQQYRIPQSNGYVQPSVVYDAARGYIAFMRSRLADHVYRSTSKDGRHWTPAAATSLPNNNASIQALRLPNGAIVLAFNDTSAELVDGKRRTGPRKPLDVAVSTDDGLSWHDFHTLEAGRPGVTAMPKAPGREAYSYPAIALGHDGRIYVAYTFRRETIKVVSFPPQWLVGSRSKAPGRDGARQQAGRGSSANALPSSERGWTKGISSSVGAAGNFRFSR